MFLRELFDSQPHDLKGQLRAAILDVLTPLVAQGVPYTTVDAVIDELQAQGSTHLRIDRALVMQLCEPNEMKLVKKIEGDQLHFTLPEPDRAADTDAEDERDAEKVKRDAVKQAKKHVKPNKPKRKPSAI